MKFSFAIPPININRPPMYNAAVQLSAAVERLVDEKRTHCIHSDQRAENVAEHSLMLAVVASTIAAEFYPRLDSGLVAKYAAIHDIIEAYVGDTPTHDIDSKGLAYKKELERLGLARLCHEYSHLPTLVQSITEYEDQIIPEARFVRVVDKWMPLTLHIINGGCALPNFTNPNKIRENTSVTAARLSEEYPEFADLINIRRELAEETARLMLTEEEKQTVEV